MRESKMRALEQEKGWVVWCRANPGKMDKGRQAFKQCGRRIFTGKCKQFRTDLLKTASWTMTK
jgi:hypothetical protein